MDGFALLIELDAEEPDAAEVLVDGAIGDKKYRFLLDTGAARSSVNFDEYTAMLTSAEKSHSSGIFAKSSYDLITVPQIALGPISRSDFTLVRAAGNSREQRNLIGMDLLKDYCCYFRFDESRVVVNPGEDAVTAFQELIFDKSSHPYVTVSFGELIANVVWDTGAGLTIVDQGFIHAHPDIFQAMGQSTGTDSTGTSMETGLYMMAASVIGGHNFPALKVAAVDLAGVNSTIDIAMDMILGYNAMKHANWLFDFPRKRWAITKMQAGKV